MTTPSGHVEVRRLARGDKFYIAGRHADGTQFRKALGKAWGIEWVGGRWRSKRSPGNPPAGFLTLRQAEARLDAELSGDGPLLVRVNPSRTTFGEAAEARLQHLEVEKQRKRSTLDDYASVVRKVLVPYFGTTPVEDITTLDIEAFKTARLGQVGHRTVQKEMVILHGILAHAKRRGLIATNPAEDAEKISLRRSDDFRFLTVDQVELVARNTPGAQLADMIRVAAYTGLRMGELRALRWKNVDWSGQRLHVVRNWVNGREDTPKSHSRRTVPLSDQAMAALDAQSRRSPFIGPDDRVFPNEVGEPVSDDQVRRQFRTALKLAGVEPMRWHDLRHSFGTLAASRGIELVRIKEWLGHADIQTTMIYAHYAPAHDDAKRLTHAFKSGSESGSELPDSGVTERTWQQSTAR